MTTPLQAIGFLAMALGGSLAAAGARGAEATDATCRGYGALSDGATIRLGRVSADALRVNFVKGSDDDRTCPAATAACRAKAFLVPGNLVILGASRGSFVCADYVGAKGQERAGWLPADTVTPDAAPAPTAANWVGRWSREEATIIVKPGSKAGTLTVKGDATYGAKDPDRVRRGAVNIGTLEGTIAPAGAELAFAMGQDKAGQAKTLPIGAGEEFDCKVWMKRLGPWLLVDDNNNCGGMNVSFRGTYVRAK